MLNVSTGARRLARPSRSSLLTATRSCLRMSPGRRVAPSSKSSQFALKLNQSSGDLKMHNGFKARHSFNPNHKTPLPARFRDNVRPCPVEHPAIFAGATCDLLFKFIFCDAAVRRRTLNKGDIGSAFAKAPSPRRVIIFT